MDRIPAEIAQVKWDQIGAADRVAILKGTNDLGWLKRVQASADEPLRVRMAAQRRLHQLAKESKAAQT